MLHRFLYLMWLIYVTIWKWLAKCFQHLPIPVHVKICGISLLITFSKMHTILPINPLFMCKLPRIVCSHRNQPASVSCDYRNLQCLGKYSRGLTCHGPSGNHSIENIVSPVFVEIFIIYAFESFLFKIIPISKESQICSLFSH